MRIKRETWGVAAMLAVIFAAGVGAGALLHARFGGSAKTQDDSRRRQSNPEEVMKDLADRLRLTDTQRARVEAIVRQHLDRLPAINRTWVRSRSEVFESLMGAMRPELTPEQQAGLDEFAQGIRQRQQRHLERNAP